MKKDLDAMSDKLNGFRDMLLKFEELEDTRLIEISQLELDKEKLAQDLMTKTKEVANSETLLEACEIERKLAMDEVSPVSTLAFEDSPIYLNSVIDFTYHPLNFQADQRMAELTARIAALETNKTDMEVNIIFSVK